MQEAKFRGVMSPKTLILYPRPLMFLVDLHLNKRIIAQDLISGVFVNCKSERVVLGNLELNRRSRRNTGSHVTTSQRCDVPTSQRHDAWSTKESQQVTQRRDVTMISASASLKALET